MKEKEVKANNNNGKENVINENLSDSDFLLSQSGSALSIKIEADHAAEKDGDLIENIKEKYRNFPKYLNEFSQELKESMDFNKWTIYNLFAFLPTIFATIIYLITLTGCFDTEFECLEKYPLHILKYLLYAVLACGFLFSLQLVLFFFGKCSKLQLITTATTIIFLCFIYDTGTDLKSHGGYNRIVLFIAMCIWAFLYFIYFIVRFSLGRKPILTILILSTLLFFSYLKISHSLQTSCEGWEIGFKNTKINNMDSKCKIDPPGTCYFKIFDGVFDVSRVFGLTCENMPTNKWSNNEKYVADKSAKILGFPRTEKYKIFPDSNDGRLQKKVINELINMEDPKIDAKIKEEIEVTLDISKNPPIPSINLKYDQNLVNNRKKIYKKYENNVLSKNVLYIFIDSLSRTNIRRKLPKFYKWIEDKYIPDTKGKPGKTSVPKDKVKYESFQFLKYHGVGRFTGINMVPTYFGVFNIYYMGKYFLTQYKNRGYVTGQTLTYCGREVFDIDGGAIEKMHWDTYDHEMVNLFCDGNFTPYSADHYPILTGANSVRLRCLYNKSVLSYSLDYMNQFWEAYEKEPKFFRIGLTEAHEGTNEVIKYSDDELFNFFNDFEQKGHLKDTIVYIQSDHGLSMLGPYSAMALEDYEYELVLPAFFMILPTNMKDYDTVRETVRHNENSMLTPFTIYNSLNAIVGHYEYSYFDQENDIFFNKTPKSNECNSFHDFDFYFNHEFLCRCKQ
jgi:hypothetical protein